MNKKIATIVLASTVGIGALGAAAIPAMADTTSPSPSASSSTGSSSGSTGSATTDADRQADIQQRILDDLAGLVSDGTLTQEQADAVAETLASKMPAGGGHGGRGGHGGGMFGGLSTAATAIGITEDELRTELEAGKSIAQVAEAEGVSEQTVVDALVQAAKDHFAEEVASGEHTQAEVDAKLADLEARVTEMVQTEGLPQRGGPDGAAPGASTGTATPSATSSSAA